MAHQRFGRARNLLWPVHAHEHRKLIPMLFLFFLITFIYNLLRPIKTVMLVSAPGSGAQVMPYLKLWAVLPAAFLTTYLYTQLINRFDREKTFYIIVSGFFILFTLFTFFLFPYRNALECHKLAHYLSQHLPVGLSGLIIIIRYWTMTFFYILAELWSSIVLSMLFWGFANEVSDVEEATRFYGIFVLASNLSGIVSGQVGQLLSIEQAVTYLPFGHSAWEQSVYLVLGLTLIVCLLIMVIFYALSRHLSDKEKQSLDPQMVPKPKAKLSMVQSFKMLKSSAYLRYLTIIVVSYNLVYNLSEVLWINEANRAYPNQVHLADYMNEITTLTGICSTLMALFVCGTVIRRFGWRAAALIAPVLWIVTSLAFLGCSLFQLYPKASPFFFGGQIELLTWTVFFGSMQMCLGRASKYTVFDETKEIAFIPLSADEQRKGKAVVDGVAGWIGRSGGALLYQLLLLIFVDLNRTIPYVCVLFVAVTILWVWAVFKLGRKMKHNVVRSL